MRTVITNQYNNCVGCNTCVQICPKECIIMKNNHEGFWYPYIDENLCINCGLCKERCPTNYNKTLLNSNSPKVFGAKNLDENIIEKSSSGGIFSLFANLILEKNGVVFGAAFNNNMRLEHAMVDDVNNLEKLRGSKYVQSDIGNTLSAVKKELESGKHVLFIGTPCQVAGLYSFLGSNYENLLTGDLICHGVPSPKVFRDYLQRIEDKKKLKVIDYKFRNKAKGWKKPSIIIEFENGMKESSLFKKDSFTVAFSKNISLRMSCYDCKFSRIPRVADITLADFWGVSDYYPELDDDKGTSLVLINSAKGELWFDICKNSMFFKQVELEKALKNNKNATGSVKLPKLRKKFFNDYNDKGYEFVEKKYMKPEPIIYRAFKKLKIMIVKTARSI
jgi:coenzyme F420-reducing hydrogenase beta subunit